MPYYQGDFYGRGGYYRGDPGFFSFLGKVGKGVLGIGKSLLGIPSAPAQSMALALPAAAGMASTAIARVGSAARTGIGAVTGVVVKHPVLSAAGAAGTIGAIAGTMGGHRMGRGTAAVGGRRHRRMHVTNVRALRRAIRRAQGFEKLARRVMHFCSPRAPRGRAIFKRKARSKRI